MAEQDEPPPDSKLTRSKQRWAREGRFLTGRTSRPEQQRLPPGQHLTRDWPTLDLGLTPNISRERWRLDVYGAVEQSDLLGFCAVHGPAADKVHLRHSLRDHLVALRQSIARGFRPAICSTPAGRATKRRFVVLHSHDGYTTNLALEDFAAEDALLAHSWSGAPLEQEHGGPVRLVVPHLYFWKSAKWLQSIEFLEQDAPGYWEVRGYHNRGDPWKEQRYSGD